MNILHKSHSNASAFTIVELLVVIVVIGILATITIFSYVGITQRTTTLTLQSDLENASNKLKLFKLDNSAYPLTNNCAVAESSTNICLKVSSTNTSLTYQPINVSSPQAFHLTGNNSSIVYIITDRSTPYIPITCPTGYIVVPGNSTYGTNDFCVMKYGAKNVGGVATSQAALTPWVNISQTTAITTAAAACTGCHLITEAEWLTIAQNVLNVASNWSSGIVGTGYIYSGHNDSAPNSTLAADTNDSNGYYGETNTGGNQRRTLTLSNGQVIWDLAGNVWEWTQGTSTTGKPGVAGGGYAWREWTATMSHGSILPDPFPGSTGIAGSSAWNSSNGIGQIYSSADDASLRGFGRGGTWNFSIAGVLTLSLSVTPSYANTDVGFRVSK